MSQNYGRVTGGLFTAIRYTEEQLKFGATIADIIATGDDICPIIETLVNDGTEEAPVYRAPTATESANKVVGVAGLAQPIYSRELGKPGGPAGLDENGDVFKEQLPDETMSYLGTWDPRTNTPHLEDGVGNIGDSYKVHDEVGDVDYPIDLGSGDLQVRGGMTIVYRGTVDALGDAKWAVSGATGLSKVDRDRLDNSMQNLVTYTAQCVPAAPTCAVGGVILAQLTSPNNPYPEFMLEDDAGLSAITLNSKSGELRIDTDGEVANTYDVVVRVGGNLGQTTLHTVQVTVSAA